MRKNKISHFFYAKKKCGKKNAEKKMMIMIIIGRIVMIMIIIGRIVMIMIIIGRIVMIMIIIGRIVMIMIIIGRMHRDNFLYIFMNFFQKNSLYFLCEKIKIRIFFMRKNKIPHFFYAEK